jgi:hypothetical protein
MLRPRRKLYKALVGCARLTRSTIVSARAAGTLTHSSDSVHLRDWDRIAESIP